MKKKNFNYNESTKGGSSKTKGNKLNSQNSNANISCFECEQPGHMIEKCPKKALERKKLRKDKKATVEA